MDEIMKKYKNLLNILFEYKKSLRNFDPDERNII